jgi:ArsR family transcriptional regulator
MSEAIAATRARRSTPPAAEPAASFPAIGCDAVFELLADRTRRRLLKLIYDYHEVCVCRLVGGLAEPQPKISRHLALMREARLLRSRRDKTWIIYALDPQVPAWAVRVIQQMAEAAESDPVSADDRARMALIKVCGTRRLPQA